jgi:DNA-binding response OmpR family regulator
MRGIADYYLYLITQFNFIVPKKILVVDDEPDVNLTLRIALEENGLMVDTYIDPIVAIENYKAHSYDLLILDIKMPKMNGFELYEKIKKIDNEVKVCFLTALSELHEYESFRREVFPKEGERYFIQKPIENKEMLDRINEIMSSSNQI